MAIGIIEYNIQTGILPSKLSTIWQAFIKPVGGQEGEFPQSLGVLESEMSNYPTKNNSH